MFVIDSYLRNGDTEEERTAGEAQGRGARGRKERSVSSEWDGRRESRNARAAHDDGGRGHLLNADCRHNRPTLHRPAERGKSPTSPIPVLLVPRLLGGLRCGLTEAA